jgi:oxygen-independent coproporphyrinogen-3 oxidase
MSGAMIDNARAEIDAAAGSRRSTVRHLYVHIPFCARICPYCAFYKERADPAQTQRFCEALLRELGSLTARFDVAPATIFFGGGTPTALSTEQLRTVLGGFRERLDLAALQEWTIEANPGSVSARKAALLHEMGVTRISLGVQSWDDGLLETLGREHNAAQAEASFRILRDAGLRNINIDLMFGLPGQSLAQWEATLARTVALQPEHVSAYCLTYEEDTEFFVRQTRGEYRADIEIDAQFFETTMRVLEAAGYQQYEISNYARPASSRCTIAVTGQEQITSASGRARSRPSARNDGRTWRITASTPIACTRTSHR